MFQDDGFFLSKLGKMLFKYFNYQINYHLLTLEKSLYPLEKSFEGNLAEVSEIILKT